MSRQESLAINVIVGIISLGFAYYGQYIAILCIIPVLIADFLPTRCVGKTGPLSIIVKLMLLAQGLGIWWLYSIYLSAANEPILQHTQTIFDRTNSIIIETPQSKIHHSSFIIDGILNLIDNPPNSFDSRYKMNTQSKELLNNVIGKLPAIKFPDLEYRTTQEIHVKMKNFFDELPEDGYLTEYKNPCWIVPDDQVESVNSKNSKNLACLPYAYVLGQPKCGTSDLFERLKDHPQIKMPKRKEVRFFTRGEFSTDKLLREGMFPEPYIEEDQVELHSSFETNNIHRETIIGPDSSIYDFTVSFKDAINEIAENDPKENSIIIDGGPHTFWW